MLVIPPGGDRPGFEVERNLYTYTNARVWRGKDRSMTIILDNSAVYLPNYLTGWEVFRFKGSLLVPGIDDVIGVRVGDFKNKDAYLADRA